MLFLAVASPGLVAIKSAVGAETALRGKFGEAVRSMRTEIEDSDIIPMLAELSGDVHFRSGEPIRNAVNDAYEAVASADPTYIDDAFRSLRELVEGALQDARIRTRLNALRDLFFDLGNAGRLWDEARRWGYRKGFGSGVAISGWLLFMLPPMFGDISLGDPWLLLGAGVGMTGLVYAGSSWVEEMRFRTELSKLIRRYE